jgi:hypothetical protein
MKKTNRLVLALAALALILAFSGCEILEDVSAKDRMQDFIADVNAGNYDLQKHTSPTASMYITADEDFWQTELETYIPFNSLSEVYENDDAACYTAIGNGPVTFTFVLIKAGNSFLIQSITKGVSTSVFN